MSNPIPKNADAYFVGKKFDGLPSDQWLIWKDQGNHLQLSSGPIMGMIFTYKTALEFIERLDESIKKQMEPIHISQIIK